MTTPTLREQLVNLRQESGVSQAELAQWIGVTQTAVSYWESGRRQPGLDDVERWAAALGATPTLLQGSPTAGSNPLAGDLVGRLTAALLAEPWNTWPKSAHGEHRYDASCAVCQGDVDRLAAWVVRFMEPEVLVAEVDRFHADGQGEKLADAYDLDLQADALRKAADAWETPAPGTPTSIGLWLRVRADQLEQEAERLRDSVPTPVLGQVIDVDGEPVRVQAAPDMPDEVRDALADVVRTIRRNHDRTLSDQETVAPVPPTATGKESLPLRDRMADAIRQVVRISPGPSALADLNAGRSIAISGGEADDAALAALPVVEEEIRRRGLAVADPDSLLRELDEARQSRAWHKRASEELLADLEKAEHAIASIQQMCRTATIPPVAELEARLARRILAMIDPKETQ